MAVMAAPIPMINPGPVRHHAKCSAATIEHARHAAVAYN
jgi:hypothetical protein